MSNFAGTKLGLPQSVIAMAGAGSPNIVDMHALNSGVAMRFATPTLAGAAAVPSGVWLNWQGTPAGVTVNLRVETDNAGKPSGTLYDANATAAFSPAGGWQEVTFGTAPAGLASNTVYHVVLLTTTAGTSATLNADSASGAGLPTYPAGLLTAADGTTRANFAESPNATPLATLAMGDGSEQRFGLSPWSSVAYYSLYGTRALGTRLVLQAPVSVKALAADLVYENVAPASMTGDFRLQVYDASGVLVAGTQVVVPRTYWAGASQVRSVRFNLPAVVTLAAGTYYVVADNTDHASTSANSYGLISGNGRSAAVLAAGLSYAETADVTAANWPVSATVIASRQSCLGVEIDDIPAAAGGGGGIFGNSLNGGLL